MKPVSKAVGNRRLLKLADLLEKLPQERFDMKYWVGNGWKGKPDLSCGTTACALGWATTVPSLRKAGLKLATTPSHRFSRVCIREPNATVDSFDDSLASGAKIFGITLYESSQLFMDVSIKSPKAMAKLIRKFVKGRS